MNMIDLTADSETSESEEDSYECKTCGKCYSELTELLSHTLAHSAQSTEEKTDNVPNSETTIKPPNEKALNTETVNNPPGDRRTSESSVAINLCDEVVDLTDNPVPIPQVQTKPTAIGNSELISRDITEASKSCSLRKGQRIILPKQTNISQSFSTPVPATSISRISERPKEGLTLVLDLTQNSPVSFYGVTNLAETGSVHSLSSTDPKAGQTRQNRPAVTQPNFRVIAASSKRADAGKPVRQAPSDILSDKDNQTSRHHNKILGGPANKEVVQASCSGNGYHANANMFTTKDPRGLYTACPDTVTADIEDGSDMNVDDDDVDPEALIIDDTDGRTDTESHNTNTEQPSKSHDNVAQPSKSHGSNMEQPSESHNTNTEQPSKSHGSNMEQPSESHDTNMEPPLNLPHKCQDCGKSFASVRQLLYHSQVHFSQLGLKCSVCYKVCKSVSGLLTHLATHNESNSFCCNWCDKKFFSRPSLRNHIFLHSPERRYKCGICGTAFKLKAVLKRHMSIHTGERPYTCSECGRGFRLKELLTAHKKTHRSFSCEICGMHFKTESILATHFKSHIVERSYHSQNKSDATPLMSDSNSLPGNPGNGGHRALHENVASTSSSDLFLGALIIDDSEGNDSHMQQPSKSQDSNMLQPSKRNQMSAQYTDKPYKCKFCGARFKLKQSLQRHVTLHTGERPYTCSECGLGFRRKESLNNHMKVHKFLCVVCGMRFKTESILTLHVQSHIVERTYHSQNTSDSDTTPLTSDSNSLPRDPGNGSYIASDENNSPVAASDSTIVKKSSESKDINVKKERDGDPKEVTLKSKCLLKIKLEGAMAAQGLPSEKGQDRNESSGSEMLPHKCFTCGLSFPEFNKLSAHSYTHGVENTHSCHICGMVFAPREAKRQHLEHLDLHRKNKSQDCVVCGKKDFKYHSNLKKHMVSHSDVRSHKCKLCGKTFKRIDTLNLHLKVHMDDRPYKCVICRKGFKSSSSRAFHLQTHLVEGQRNAGKLLKPKIEKMQKLNNYASKVGKQGGEKVEQNTSASPNTRRIKLEGRHRKIKEERHESLIHKNNAVHKSNEKAKDATDWVNLPRQVNLLSPMEVNAVVGTDLTVAAAARMNVQSPPDNDTRVSSQSRNLPYKCTKCDKSFLKFHQLSFHSRIHKDDSPIKCHVCGMVFALQDSLNEHLLMHKKGETLQCIICGKKGFISKIKLASHMVVHSDVRPYECETCGKGFKRTTDLRLHERYHTDENPYECVICRKGFKSASARSSHLKVHLVKRKEQARTLSKPQENFPQYASTGSSSATSSYHVLSAATDKHVNEKQEDSSIRGEKWY